MGISGDDYAPVCTVEEDLIADGSSDECGTSRRFPNRALCADGGSGSLKGSESADGDSDTDFGGGSAHPNDRRACTRRSHNDRCARAPLTIFVGGALVAVALWHSAGGPPFFSGRAPDAASAGTDASDGRLPRRPQIPAALTQIASAGALAASRGTPSLPHVLHLQHAASHLMESLPRSSSVVSFAELPDDGAQLAEARGKELTGPRGRSKPPVADHAQHAVSDMFV